MRVFLFLRSYAQEEKYILLSFFKNKNKLIEKCNYGLTSNEKQAVMQRHDCQFFYDLFSSDSIKWPLFTSIFDAFLAPFNVISIMPGVAFLPVRCSVGIPAFPMNPVIQ